MARFVNVNYPVRHGGVTRFTRIFEVAGNLNATHLVLGGLAVIGSPVTRAAAAVRRGLADWAAGREARKQDEKLFSIALSDARVMADLSRAMSRDAKGGACASS
jgi:hypothetical protein